MIPTRRTKLVAFVAAALLAGCGYAPMALSPISEDVARGPGLVTRDALPRLPAGVSARSLTVEPATGTAYVGASFPLKVRVTGSDGKAYTDARLVSWSLSNPQQGAIDQNGVLLAQLPGSLKVLASIGNARAEATIQIEQARFMWQQMMSPTQADLKAVAMVSQHEAWAGGAGGVLLRYLNGAWQREPNFRAPDAVIRGLGFANSGLGWAVGARAGDSAPFLARFSNGFWRTERLPISQGVLNALSVVSANDAWAVGQEDNGDALILHWDGGSWKQVLAPSKGKLNDVQMLSGKLGYAVGRAEGVTQFPLIFKYNGTEWEKVSWWFNRDSAYWVGDLELKSIKMVSETQGYAVGVRDPLLLKPRGLFLEFDSQRGGWRPGMWDQKVSNLDQVPLNDIDMVSGAEGWALGETRRPDFVFQRNPQSIFGNLLANDNGLLRTENAYFTGNLSGTFNAIALTPQGQGFVVGSGGFILQRTFDWRNGQPFGDGASPAPITHGPGGPQAETTTPIASE